MLFRAKNTRNVKNSATSKTDAILTYTKSQKQTTEKVSKAPSQDPETYTTTTTAEFFARTHTHTPNILARSLYQNPRRNAPLPERSAPVTSTTTLRDGPAQRTTPGPPRTHLSTYASICSFLAKLMISHLTIFSSDSSLFLKHRQTNRRRSRLT